MTTGTKIRLLREQRGWDQSVIANKLEITQPAVSKLESDQTKLSWDNAVKLASLFEVDPEYFFDSTVNNYVYNNQKVNQLFNSDYSETDIEFIKILYSEHLKSKDDLLQERSIVINDLKEQIAELKKELAELKKQGK
ncbi:helix-turn-helix domain-containing protein [Mucilaginibacter aquaedulcis]|uniref:helix-turn-helix domain-containing protein n=1 Tax=Mucilaginibacter aquaedulcis TaxID=1187081 RepID=UPI0025B5CBAD|nr:helix-turn-helix transcriptional regulator [Mucilaginibacter aquaedulcis]MDN3548919.1 helix-turn-helix transcriptional regulator [Mucilaginibacter aquaedulcis]